MHTRYLEYKQYFLKPYKLFISKQEPENHSKLICVLTKFKSFSYSGFLLVSVDNICKKNS